MRVNDLVSSCLSENCSFNYSSVTTPRLTGISPSNARPGELVTINGTGFSSNKSEVTVRIGNVECVVNSSSESQITFTLGEYAAYYK